jgi:hypothetical protein
MEGVKTLLSSQAAGFFDTCIQNLFHDMTNASILIMAMLRSSLSMVTTLRNSLSMYVFFAYNIFFSLLVLLTAHV